MRWCKWRAVEIDQLSNRICWLWLNAVLSICHASYAARSHTSGHEYIEPHTHTHTHRFADCFAAFGLFFQAASIFCSHFLSCCHSLIYVSYVCPAFVPNIKAKFPTLPAANCTCLAEFTRLSDSLIWFAAHRYSLTGTQKDLRLHPNNATSCPCISFPACGFHSRLALPLIFISFSFLRAFYHFRCNFS